MLFPLVPRDAIRELRQKRRLALRPNTIIRHSKVPRRLLPFTAFRFLRPHRLTELIKKILQLESHRHRERALVREGTAQTRTLCAFQPPSPQHFLKSFVLDQLVKKAGIDGIQLTLKANIG